MGISISFWPADAFLDFLAGFSAAFDVAAEPPTLLRRDRLAGALLVNELNERGFVLVFELVRLEVAGFLVDENRLELSKPEPSRYHKIIDGGAGGEALSSNHQEVVLAKQLSLIRSPDALKLGEISGLVGWVGGTNRECAVEIFTPNYDLLFEEAFERAGFPYFDGFTGGHAPFFDPPSIADDVLPARWSRLWKLHGSLVPTFPGK
jgi:hypothetical protein